MCWKPTPEKETTEAEKAEEWLLEFMDGERVLASEVENAAKAEGIARNTLQRAKKNLRVASLRELNQWFWLPPLDESITAA